jgi:hypothetical protein
VEIKDVLHNIISRYLLEQDLMQKLLEGSEILCRTSIRFPLANLSIEDVLHNIISCYLLGQDLMQKLCTRELTHKVI